MEIPVGVDVICGTEVCGQSRYIIVNPVNDRVTHLVVAEKALPHSEYLVPSDSIASSTTTSIQLLCSPEELSNMDRFVDTEYIRPDEVNAFIPYNETALYWPYSYPAGGTFSIKNRHIPANEVVIGRRSLVQATDGTIGKVDEFLINPLNDKISHIILREGHLWGKKDVTVPVSQIEKISDGVVFLKLDKKTVAELPGTPVNRKWK